MNKILFLLGLSAFKPTDRAVRVRNRMLAVAMFVAAAIAFSVKPVVALGAGKAMALLDAEGLLSDAQALTATALSTNTYDSGAAGNEIGSGEPMCAVITVDVAAKTSDANETYRFSLVQSANADLSSSDELLTTNVTFITRAVLVAGYQIVLPLPMGMKTKRYLGTNYTLGGTNPAITVTTAFVPLRTVSKYKSYASGFSVGS